jgi:uncharacterized protein YjiK
MISPPGYRPRPGTVPGIILAGAIALCAAGCGEPGAQEPSRSALDTFRIAGRTYSPDARVQYKLPKVLREISGLALDDAGRLFAHNDEDGILYQIDYENGKVIHRFALDGVARADFEGIAVVGDRLYLTTSRGEIFETRIGGPDEMVPYERHEARLDCEVEGLTFSPRHNALLAACKNLPKGSSETGVELHAWDLDRRAYDDGRILSVPRSALRALPGLAAHRKIQPSGITMAPNGHLIIVAGRQHLLLELTAEGVPVGTAALDADRHRQTEGIAVTASGVLILADEGDGRGKNKSRGRLSVYAPVE